MAEKFKDVTIKSYEFRIRKFSAMDGAYIIPKVTGLLAPVFQSLMSGMDIKHAVTSPGDIDLSKLDISALLGPLAKIPEEDFKYLQRKCLNVCQLRLQGGYQPIVHDNGSFSLTELEDDAMTVLALMVHTLIHNFAGFFDGAPLAELVSTILPSNSPN